MPEILQYSRLPEAFPNVIMMSTDDQTPPSNPGGLGPLIHDSPGSDLAEDPVASDPPAHSISLGKADPLLQQIYYQKLRESAERFALELNTAATEDDLTRTWRSLNQDKQEMVITTGLRCITYDPEIDFDLFDNLAASGNSPIDLSATEEESAQERIAEEGGGAFIGRVIQTYAAARQ
ncbi:hypothetical protein B0H34DRAFT_679887 [Crassisporium funariophilum]|nr:hypothetical protein B0H34DRAFT_679887 [Crassisporium funariophilum]